MTQDKEITNRFHLVSYQPTQKIGGNWRGPYRRKCVVQSCQIYVGNPVDRLMLEEIRIWADPDGCCMVLDE